MANTFTPTTNAYAIPTVIAQEVLKLLSANVGLAKFVSRDADWTGKDFASYGDTLQITRPGDLTVKTKVPGTPIVYQNPNLDKISVTLDQHKYIAVLQEDVTKMLQKPQMQSEYARNIAIKLSEGVDSFLFGLHTGITNTVTFNGSTEATIDASMRELRSRFSRLKVPQNAERVLFAETSVIDKLLSVTKYTSRDYAEGRAIMDGALMKIYNNNIFESQLVPSTGSPVAYHNLALTKYGLVLVTRPMPTDGDGKGVKQTVMTDPDTGISMRLTEGYDKDNMGTTFNMDLLYGGAVADVNQIIEVESF